MTCPSCMIALSGFGQDAPSAPPSPIQLPPKAASDLGTGILALIVGPLIGSVIATPVGAIVWKQHRVWGGVIGFLLGGAIGGVIGTIIAKNKITAALPDLQKAIESGTDLPAGTADPFAPPPGGWTTGPLSFPGANVGMSMLPSMKNLFPSAQVRVPSDALPSDGVRNIVAGTTMDQALNQPATAAPLPGKSLSSAMPLLKCPAGSILMGSRCIPTKPSITTKPVSQSAAVATMLKSRMQTTLPSAAYGVPVGSGLPSSQASASKPSLIKTF